MNYNPKYFRSHSEAVEFYHRFLDIKGGRETQVSQKQLDEFMEAHILYGTGYEVICGRTPENDDCVIRRKDDGAEFSASDWVRKLIYIKNSGSNSIALFGLKWIAEHGWIEDFFIPPTQGVTWKGAYTGIKINVVTLQES